MKTMVKNVVPVLAVLCVLLSGCTKKDKGVDLARLSSEDVFAEDSQYVYLSQLLGGMSQRDLFDLLENVVVNLDAAVRHGDASPEDFTAIKNIIINAHTWMSSVKATNSAVDLASSPLVELIDMMIENGVGNILTDAVRAAEPDILLANVYPMLDYLMNCDQMLVKDAVAGVTLKDLVFDASKINKEDFQKAISALHGIFNDEDADYHAIRVDLTGLFDAIKTNGPEITIGEVKEFVTDLGLTLDSDSLSILLDVVSAVIELMHEDPTIKVDLNKLVYAVDHLVTVSKAPDGNNSWDACFMTDFERVLYCLEDVFKPANTHNLKIFLYQVLEGVDNMQGADNVYGLTSSLAEIYNTRNATTNTIPDLTEIDYALYCNMIQLNMNNSPTVSDTIKVSELRTALFLLDVLKNLSDGMILLPYGLNGLALSLVEVDPSVPVNARKDMLEFVAGLLAEGMYCYPQSYHASFGSNSALGTKSYPDPFAGLDWVFYQEGIGIDLAGFPVTIPGAMDMLTSVLKYLYIDNILLGIVADPIPSINELVGNGGTRYSTGSHHRLMSLAAPILSYYYEQGHGSEMIRMAAALNEIPLDSYKNLYWYGSNATLRQDNLGTVLESIEGPHGYGLVYYALRGASPARDEGTADILDPALDLIVRILYKLANTDHGTNSNLLRDFCNVLVGSVSTVKKTNQEIVDTLFNTDGPVENLYTFLNQNHTQLTQIVGSVGRSIDKVMDQTNDGDNANNIFYAGSEHVVVLLQAVLETLGTEFSSPTTSSAVKTMVNNVLMQADADAAVTTATSNLAGTVCGKADRICHDLSQALPAAQQFVDALNIDISCERNQTKIQPLVDYLTQEVGGQENPLIFNLKALGYKLAGIYDATYNTRLNALKVDDNTPVTDLITHLVGDDGLYRLGPLTGFLSDLTANNGDILCRLLGVGESGSVDIEYYLDKIFGEDMEDMISWTFCRSLFVSYNGNDPVVLAVLKIIHLDHNGQPIEFNGVLYDINTFIKQMEFQPGKPYFDRLYDVLGLVIKYYCA